MSGIRIRSLILLSLSVGVCLGQRCGLSTTTSRIVGGQSADAHEWPWMALLKIRSESDLDSGTYHECGGTLISDQWILTAAHCVKSTSDPVKRIEVILGEHIINKKEGSELKLYGREVDSKTDNYDLILNGLPVSRSTPTATMQRQGTMTSLW